MVNRKSKLLIGLVGAACVACCAVPISGLVILAVGSSATVASFFATDGFKEILVCLLPLLILSIGLVYVSRRKKPSDCCATTGTSCNTTPVEPMADKK